MDLIIVGCGLAGASIAWMAHWRGWQVAIVDREDPESCSRVAAGLVTPITGSRAAVSWRWDSFYPAADKFYRKVEANVEAAFWVPAPAVRIYSSEKEREIFQARWPMDLSNDEIDNRSRSEVDSLGNGFYPTVAPWRSNAGVSLPFDAIEMVPAARLLTERYLDATQAYFSDRGAFYRCDLDCDRELEIASEINVPKLEISSERIVFCQGIDARRNRWFANLPLHPARGDILDVHSEVVRLDRVVHSDVWIAPLGESIYRIGATYNRHLLDGVVDDRAEVHAAREELLFRLKNGVQLGFDTGKFEIVRHRAAVRPASYDRHPLLGKHPHHSNVFCMNGLGSKGSLMSPFLAESLLEHMRGSVLDPDFDWRRRERK